MSDWRPDGQAPLPKNIPEISSSQAERLAGKEEEKRQRRLKRLEEEIEQLEEKIAELKDELCKPEYASMYSKLSEIQSEIDDTEAKLLSVMETWESESA